MTLKIGILNVDDIGHEIVPAAVEVVRAAAKRHGLSIDWTPLPIGRTALDTHGSTMPDSRRTWPDWSNASVTMSPRASGA